MAGRRIARKQNFTDPDSRILPTRDGFIQGYNGQIAVDAAHQVIVAHRLVTTSADYRALAPLVNDISVHLGRKPREVSGDAGFATEANLAVLKKRHIKGYLPPGRARHGEAHAAGRRKLTRRPLMNAMAATLKRAAVAAVTGSESRWSSPSSDKSNRREASANSSYAALIMSEPSGR